MNTTVGLKYWRTNKQHKLGTKQHQKGRQGTSALLTWVVLSVPLGTSCGSGLAHTEAEL